MTEQEAPFEKPDRKVLIVWVLSSLMGYGFVSALLGVPAIVMLLIGRPKPTFFYLAVAPMLLWLLTVIFLRRQWELWGYRLTERTLEIRHGLIWRQYRIVGRDRIQHIDINSGPFDRKFGLVQVVIHTAGAVVGMIPGLTPEKAEALRSELTKNMPAKGEEPA